MTDADLAQAHGDVKTIDRVAREQMRIGDTRERDEAVTIIRLAGSLRRALEDAIVERATRAPRDEARVT